MIHDDTNAAWTRNEIRAIAREEIQKASDRFFAALERELGMPATEPSKKPPTPAPKLPKRNWQLRFFKPLR